MDKLMQPCRLNLDPGSNSAAKEWKHWFKTFENYVEVFTDAHHEERRNFNKFKVLVNCVSHQVHDHIDECETYEAAIQVLKSLYVKTPNVVFTRHLLLLQSKKRANL